MIACMTCSPASPALLYFPCLHPALATVAPPKTVRFLDPGLGEPAAPRLFRPAGLPLAGTELSNVVREFERLRAEVKNPKDIALLADASGGHFFTDTSFAVREELEDQLHPERVEKRRLVAAQLTLCLAYLLEESLAAMTTATDLETRFRAAMADSLGLGDDPDGTDATALEAIVSAGGVPSAAALTEEFGRPWRRMLSPFWAIAPASVGLFTVDPEPTAAWMEAGLPLVGPSPQEATRLFGEEPPTGRLLTIRECGWRLLGKTRPDAASPWLDTPRTVVVLQP